MAAHLLCGNQVSFFLGELVIQHGCNPFPGRMRKQPVSPLPTSIQKLLHLLCESAVPDEAANRTRRHMPAFWQSSAGRAATLQRWATQEAFRQTKKNERAALTRISHGVSGVAARVVR